MSLVDSKAEILKSVPSSKSRESIQDVCENLRERRQAMKSRTAANNNESVGTKSTRMLRLGRSASFSRHEASEATTFTNEQGDEKSCLTNRTAPARYGRSDRTSTKKLPKKRWSHLLAGTKGDTGTQKVEKPSSRNPSDCEDETEDPPAETTEISEMREDGESSICEEQSRKCKSISSRRSRSFSRSRSRSLSRSWSPGRRRRKRSVSPGKSNNEAKEQGSNITGKSTFLKPSEFVKNSSRLSWYKGSGPYQDCRNEEAERGKDKNLGREQPPTNNWNLPPKLEKPIKKLALPDDISVCASAINGMHSHDELVQEAPQPQKRKGMIAALAKEVNLGEIDDASNASNPLARPQEKRVPNETQKSTHGLVTSWPKEPNEAGFSLLPSFVREQKDTPAQHEQPLRSCLRTTKGLETTDTTNECLAEERNGDMFTDIRAVPEPTPLEAAPASKNVQRVSSAKVRIPDSAKTGECSAERKVDTFTGYRAVAKHTSPEILALASKRVSSTKVRRSDSARAAASWKPPKPPKPPHRSMKKKLHQNHIDDDYSCVSGQASVKTSTSKRIRSLLKGKLSFKGSKPKHGKESKVDKQDEEIIELSSSEDDNGSMTAEMDPYELLSYKEKKALNKIKKYVLETHDLLKKAASLMQEDIREVDILTTKAFAFANQAEKIAATLQSSAVWKGRSYHSMASSVSSCADTYSFVDRVDEEEYMRRLEDTASIDFGASLLCGNKAGDVSCDETKSIAFETMQILGTLNKNLILPPAASTSIHSATAGTVQLRWLNYGKKTPAGYNVCAAPGCGTRYQSTQILDDLGGIADEKYLLTVPDHVSLAENTEDEISVVEPAASSRVGPLGKDDDVILPQEDDLEMVNKTVTFSEAVPIVVDPPQYDFGEDNESNNSGQYTYATDHTSVISGASTTTFSVVKDMVDVVGNRCIDRLCCGPGVDTDDAVEYFQ
jgi:hypothetical protein